MLRLIKKFLTKKELFSVIVSMLSGVCKLSDAGLLCYFGTVFQHRPLDICTIDDVKVFSFAVCIALDIN